MNDAKLPPAENARPSPESPSKLLKEILRQKGWTQTYFAERLGLHPSAFSMILREERQLPRGKILRLSEITGNPPKFWEDRIREYAEYVATPQGMLAKALSRANESLGKAGLSDQLVPGLMADHQILKAIQLGELQLIPFDPNQVQSSSIDLYLGAIEGMDDETAEGVIEEKGALFTLKKGKMAVARSLEKISLSKKLVGRVGIPTALARLGCIVTYGLQIDPGYEGNLLVTIWNPVADDCELIVGKTKILSIEMTVLNLPAMRSIKEIRPDEFGDIPTTPIT